MSNSCPCCLKFQKPGPAPACGCWLPAKEAWICPDPFLRLYSTFLSLCQKTHSWATVPACTPWLPPSALKPSGTQLAGDEKEACRVLGRPQLSLCSC